MAIAAAAARTLEERQRRCNGGEVVRLGRRAAAIGALVAGLRAYKTRCPLLKMLGRVLRYPCANAAGAIALLSPFMRLVTSQVARPVARAQ